MMTAPVKILVVDDEPKICEFLETFLQREGYVTECAPSGDAAIQKLSSSEFNLVISDLKMPGMDGFELARRVKAVKQDLPFVVITGYATLATAIQALREGVDDYVTKPFKIDEMRKVISRVLENSRLELENRRLIVELESANDELRRHREALKDRVRLANDDLRRANVDLGQRLHELAMLNVIGVTAASEFDLDKMIADCARVVAEKLSVTKTCVMLRDGDWLIVKACEGGDSAKLVGSRMRVGEGVAGRVAESGEPIMVLNVAADPQQSIQTAGVSAANSLACVPITYKARNLGVMTATDKKSGEAFTPSDMRLLITIASQVAPAIDNARLYRRLEESTYATVRALVAGLEAKDRYLRGHAMRVTRYAVAIGQTMGMDKKEIATLERAGQLHDLGKLGISDVILHKPTFLTTNEYDVVKQHPVFGEQIIQPLDFLSDTRPLIRHHHERFDGKGYPDGKRGDELDLSCRIMTVADAFDAMTTARPYRPAKNDAEARREIMSLRSRQFDPRVADAFCNTVIPQGTLGTIGS